MLTELFKKIAAWYMLHISYGSITLLMTIESTFFPLPSELVVPPAAWKAAQGDINVFLVVLFATLGAILGSLFNYYFALILGRKLIYKFAESKAGKLFLLSPEKVEKAETYFLKHGRSSTFVGRLVPGIRHLISIPAGLARMNIKDFIISTASGSLLWHSILAALGYFIYTQKELLNKYFKELSYLLLAIGVCFAIYLIVKYIKKKE
jgi:membrane protein DedA with SNARE-associated domain